jgi:hypothetical protein
MPTLIPKVTTLDDTPLYERRRSVAAAAGVVATARWTMVDDAGNPVDLTAYNVSGAFPAVVAKVGEAVWKNSGIATVTGSIADAAHGVVTLPLNADGKLTPAIYDVDVAVCDVATGNALMLNRFYLHVERSMFSAQSGTRATPEGPPTRQEVRLRLRDSSPAESRLLDTLQFDDAEIAAALVRAVEVYNDSLPPTSTLDTSTFPFGGLWLDGARAALFESAADWYARNQLAAAAGGVQVDDMAKAPYYLQQSDKLWASYKAAVKARKVSENARTGGRYIGSPYGYIGGPTSRS